MIIERRASSRWPAIWNNVPDDPRNFPAVGAVGFHIRKSPGDHQMRLP